MPGLRPLGLGEILDVGIKLCLRHWRTLALCMVWLVVPVQILSALVLLSVAPDALDPTQDSTAFDTDETDFLVALLIVYVLQGLVVAISTAACFKAVSDAYLGSAPRARRSLAFGARRLPKLIALALVLVAGYAIVVGVIVGVAVVAPVLAALIGVALIVPACWLVVSLALSTPVLLFENTGPVRAITRSVRLVKGRWWKIALTLFVGLLLVYFVAGILQQLLLFVPALLADGNDVVLVFATVVSGTIGTVLTTPFTAAVISLVYFDQRVRKEGFDLELLAAGLGESAPSGDAPGVPYLAPEVTPEQRAQAPFWPPPPGWTPPEPASSPSDTPSWAEPVSSLPDAPPGADPVPSPESPPAPGGWQPPAPPRWPPESPERRSGGL
jgi:MFS family permease